MLLFPDGSLTSDVTEGQRDKTDAGRSKEKEEEDIKAGPPSKELSSPPALEVSSRPAKRSPPPENEQEPGSEANGQVENRPAKMQRLEKVSEVSNVCKAPPEVNTAIESVTLRRKDVYLEEGWRERLCRCEKVSRVLPGHQPSPAER
jgi:hypothetical protein